MADFPDFSLAQQSEFSFVTVGPGATSAQFDVTRFQSLIIEIVPTTTPFLPSIAVQKYSPSGVVIWAKLLSADTSGAPVLYTIPVVGATISFTNNTTDSPRVLMTGLAATLPPGIMGQFYPTDTRACTVPNAAASGTQTRFANTNAGPIGGSPTCTYFRGQVAIRWSIASMGGATNMVLFAAFIDENGNRLFQAVTEMTALGNKEFEWGHPDAGTSWWVINTGVLTSSSGQSLTIFPANPGGC